MQRIWIFLFQLSLLGLLGKSQAHEQSHLGSTSGGHGYYAFLDDFHTHPSTTEATGEIFLSLNADQTRLTYRIVLDHLLGLKPNAVDRTEPDDIIGIHLHLHVPDTIGPHVLNIFGLATYNQPAEEDADRVIDYENRTITGVWDDGDATIDPTTGLPYLPFYPLTSKPLTNWLDTLNEGRLMVAVHTNESGFPSMAIRGHISPIPEPSSWGLLASAVMLWIGRRSSLRRGEVL